VTGLHGSSLEFVSTVDMGTAGSCSVVKFVSTFGMETLGSCFVVTFVVTYFFPVPRNERQKRRQERKKKL
jgi:hypothetical protein